MCVCVVAMYESEIYCFSNGLTSVWIRARSATPTTNGDWLLGNSEVPNFQGTENMQCSLIVGIKIAQSSFDNYKLFCDDQKTYNI